MAAGIIILAVTLPMLLAAAFLLGRHLQRRQQPRELISLVTRQHIDLFQGGQLNEALVESAKSHFRELLERGEVSEVEASLRPGTQYVVQVRALAELGTEDAGRILERQLQRRLTEDQLEQSWYWLDLAHGLRNLNRPESLPNLLRCAESADTIPLSHFLAAETICFLGFSGYLQEPDTPLGAAALRVLHRALEGFRFGVPPQVVVEARLGEMIELLWDHRSERVHPLLVHILMEIRRLVRRAPHCKLLLLDGADQESFDWQVSRMAALEAVFDDYLAEAAPALLHVLRTARFSQWRDLLTALTELRAEVTPVILPLLEKTGARPTEAVAGALTWCKDPRAGAWMRRWVAQRLSESQRLSSCCGSLFRRRRVEPEELPFRAMVKALRGHPGVETEKALLRCAQFRQPRCRAAAIGSLGWWEPVLRQQVVNELNLARRDPRSEVRQAARSALARLGERQALQWFRHALTGEDAHQVHDAIQTAADEGLTLLWPDLDRLVDAANPELAFHARDALERLSEEMERG